MQALLVIEVRAKMSTMNCAGLENFRTKSFIHIVLFYSGRKKRLPLLCTVSASGHYTFSFFCKRRMLIMLLVHQRYVAGTPYSTDSPDET